MNLWGGGAFSYDFRQESVLIEGPNGSGKSSLAGAITWGLTGERPRDYSHVRAHEAQTVYSEDDQSAGSWPPIACYPPTTDDLKASEPRVRVELTFGKPDGGLATIVRSLEGEKIEVEGVSTLGIPEIFIEAGILMPSRLAQLRLKEGQNNLTDAVQKLTGLDELSAIGTLAEGLCHRSREYLAYARSQNHAKVRADFLADLDEARNALVPVSVTVRAFRPEESENPNGSMAEFGRELATRAATLTTIIADDLTPGLNLNDAKIQIAIVLALQGAKERLRRGLPASSAWQFLASLAEELSGERAARLASAINMARSGLREASHFYETGKQDSRLRLKVTAARWHVKNMGGPMIGCPLCGQALESQPAFVAELEDLGRHDIAAERSFRDNVYALKAALEAAQPSLVGQSSSDIWLLEPRSALITEIRSHLFGGSQEVALLKRFVSIVESALSRAPASQYALVVSEKPDEMPDDVTVLLEAIANAERSLALASWFQAEQFNWKLWWEDLVTGEDLPREGLLSHLARLEEAVDAATPFRLAAEAMRRAWRLGRDVAKIEKEQARREAIAEAIQPLKALKALAESVARQAISELSGKTSEILDAIHLSDRFRFHNARLNRRDGVVVRGGFVPEVRIDATLVANTSWLRAVLWAFLFALREEAIEQFGGDSFPLMVFDDPQATFDAEHRHRWGLYVAGLQGSATRVQVIITTFDETFLDLIKMDGVTGRSALIAGASQELGCIGIFEGETLDRKWEEVKNSNTPVAARGYMMDVRIHLESMLKVLLRGEGSGISMLTVNGLREKLQQLHGAQVSPWNNPIFKALLAAIDRGRPEMRYIELVHHSTGSNVGMAEAISVEKHWKKTVRLDLERGFRTAREHRALHGGLTALHAPSPHVSLPDGYENKVRSIPLKILGRAAALTNGRAADGCVNIEEFLQQDYSRVVLGHHSAYRLTAATLEPVARPGDILLVKVHGEPSPRSLVVAVSGDRIVARRFEISDNVSDVAVLTAQSINPRKIAPPIVAHKATLSLHKVIGILFDDSSLPVAPLEAEVCDCGGEGAITRLTSKALGLVEIIGQSAEPLALDGQYLIVSPEVESLASLGHLDGRPIIAADEDDMRLFKRLRIGTGQIILESLDSGGDFPPIVLSLSEGNTSKRLARVWPVVGVLFEISD